MSSNKTEATSSAIPALIDTHCHIHDRALYSDLLSRQKKSDPTAFTPEQMLESCAAAGVQKLITIGTNHADSLAARDFARRHNNVSQNSAQHSAQSASSDLAPAVFWSYGIHPEYATDFTSVEFPGSPEDGIEDTASDISPPIAIGEVGLDYHYPGYDRSAQIRLLEAMLDLALRLDLPLIFHVREAFDDFFPVLDNFSATSVRAGSKTKPSSPRTSNPRPTSRKEAASPRTPALRGVIHSFSDSPTNLEKSLNHGFYIGVNGLATFAQLPLPPLERMLLETDAPFLTPVPHRGRVNQPAHVRDVAVWLSHHLSTPVEEIATCTTANARALFRI